RTSWPSHHGGNGYAKKQGTISLSRMIQPLLPLGSWLVGFLLLWGCQSTAPEHQTTDEATIARQEAREDSLELVAAYERQSMIAHAVIPNMETEAVVAEASLDAADDPALWVHPENPDQSILIGSNKKGGLHLYALDGKEIGYFPVGNINNVDVLADFQLGDQSIVLVGGSNRSDQSLDLFQLDPETQQLIDIADGPLKVDGAKMDDVYGFCLYQDLEQNRAYAFINAKNGRVQQFELTATEAGKVSAQKVRDILFDSQVEGMVADPPYHCLYVGEEDAGIWQVPARPEDGSEKVLIEESTEANPNISFDVEGLAIYAKGEGGYLLASSQGNFSYAVFDRMPPHAYLTSFTLASGGQIDGVEETDGIEAISASLGEKYPMGVFIAQDGFNYAGDSIEAQNFKLVDWRAIDSVLQMP
ncbi:MAG: phytase, partial [Bacteroidota bacterium]